MATNLTFPLEIALVKPGAVPPVYVAGTFNDWVPTEMDYVVENSPDGSVYRFLAVFGVKQGEYQYKFRFGTGSWWDIDQTAPKGLDAAGNTNNVIKHETRSPPLNPHVQQSGFDNQSKSMTTTSVPPPIPGLPASLDEKSIQPEKPQGNGHLRTYEGADERHVEINSDKPLETEEYAPINEKITSVDEQAIHIDEKAPFIEEKTAPIDEKTAPTEEKAPAIDEKIDTEISKSPLDMRVVLVALSLIIIPIIAWVYRG